MLQRDTVKYCEISIGLRSGQGCVQNRRTDLCWVGLTCNWSVSTCLYCSWSCGGTSFTLTPLFKSRNWFLRMWEPRMIDFKREKIHLSGALSSDEGLKSNSLIEEDAEIREQRMWSLIQWQNVSRNPFGWDVLPCLRCSDCGFCPRSCFLLFTSPHTPPVFNCCSWIISRCSSALRQQLLLKINHWTW